MNHRRTETSCGLLLLCLVTLLCEIQIHAQTTVGVSPAELPTIEKYPLCTPNAQSGYKPKACLIQVDRRAPITPPPSIVPVGTTVYIELINTRWNENVTFTLTTTKTTTQDVTTAALKNALPAVQTLVLSSQAKAISGRYAAVQSNAISDFAKAIEAQQILLTKSLNTAVTTILNANAQMTCLSNYEAFQADHTCSQANMLSPAVPASGGIAAVADTFTPAMQSAIDNAKTAAGLSLPVLDIADLDAVVKSFYLTCLTYIPGLPSAEQDAAKLLCRDYGEQISSNEALLDSTLSDVQKSQDTLAEAVLTLQGWPGAPPKMAYKFLTTKNNNLSVVVAGVEVVNKINSAIATIAINPQANRWVVSAGIAGSNLVYHTYSNAPIIVNGVPTLSPSGQTETVVTQQSTSPSFIAPEALISYNVVPHYWTDHLIKCPNNCTFLLTGGIGANLTTKTADFDTGVSFQIGGTLFTPTLHFGRDTRLTNGVEVGDQLGTSPPNPLPTTNVWVMKFGFAITYVIPTP